VSSVHGDLNDRTTFERARAERERSILSLFLEERENEAFEVKELVKINASKNMHNTESTEKSSIALEFVERSKACLTEVVESDRFSVLNVAKVPRALRLHHISPRYRIPEKYDLSLSGADESGRCRVRLRELTDTGWMPILLKEVRGEGPMIEALKFAHQGLRCCSIAFAGANTLYQTTSPTTSERRDDSNEPELIIKLTKISSQDAGVAKDGVKERPIHGNAGATLVKLSGRKILGFNSNVRLLMLENHVKTAQFETLMFGPLRHFLGGAKSERLLPDNGMHFPPPGSFNSLNEQQKRFAHPLAIRTAIEGAGPPGTGKTRTITELIRSILFCTSYDVLVISERNGAIDAIAEILANDCFLVGEGNLIKIKNFSLWSKVITFGSRSMGRSTMKFTLEQKVQMHPEPDQYRRLIQQKNSAVDHLRTSMLAKLAAAVAGLGKKLPEGWDAEKRGRLIALGDEDCLSSPSGILECLNSAARAMKSLLDPKASKEMTRYRFERHSAIIGDLFPPSVWEGMTFGIDLENEATKSALEQISCCLENVLKDELFQSAYVEEYVEALHQAERDRDDAKKRIELEILKTARVTMATIGSSHKLPVPDPQNRKGTIVIFDEAGCIPSYELLGLSRLGRPIKALLCVGDKKQLPPFTPIPREKSYSASTVESILDVSGLNGEGKILLTTQYRVPRDIAKVLDDRVYEGNYKTATACKAPDRGFQLVNVPKPSSNLVKYENINEITKILEMVKKLQAETGTTSIMVLTPYKKQQVKLQFTFKSHGYSRSSIPILTIDQCQGQEADYVFLSLVQKPTKFLTVNRFNVAISRVRKKLFLLANKEDLKNVSYHDCFECHFMLKDLLALSELE